MQEAGQAGLKVPDPEVLAFATNLDRAVLTLNRKDFKRLHLLYPHHAGIVICKDDRDWQALATRIDAIVTAAAPLTGKLIRVNRIE